jgi:hypothetical protein
MDYKHWNNQRCFSFEKGFGTQRVTHYSVGEGWCKLYHCQKKEDAERRSGLRPSEKEPQERRSDAFPSQKYPWL